MIQDLKKNLWGVADNRTRSSIDVVPREQIPPDYISDAFGEQRETLEGTLGNPRKQL